MDKDDINTKEQHTLYKQIHPPTGVRRCCQAFLTHPAGKDGKRVLPNLVVARATLLQVYYAKTSPGDDEACWLELAAEYDLAGEIESLVTLQSRAPGIQRDAVLLAFRDAKLVVLDWDELSGGLVTGSLHSWEADAALQGGRSVFPRGPRALADPQGRCAAVVLFNHHLALLPSTGADSLEAVVAGGSTSRPSTLGSSYTLNLARLGVKEVRDAAFLHRYNEPVLLVLHESQPTWAGLYTERKDTMCLTAFSLNLAHQKHLRLWHAAGLPSDAHSLLPVPLGGALVLCQTLLLYHSQGVSCSLAVHSKAAAGVVPPFMDLNPMREAPSATAARHARKFATNLEPDAAAAAAAGAPRAEGVELELQDAVGAWLTPSTLLLTAASGRMALLSLEVAAGSVRRLRLRPARDGPPPSCACRLGQSWVFLGSWVADSVLLHASPEGQTKPLRLEAGAPVLALPGPGDVEHVKAEPNAESAAVGNGRQADEEPVRETLEADGRENATKRRRTEPAQNSDKGDVDDEFESIFSSIETARISTIATGFTNFTFKAVDTLVGLGPLRSAHLTPAPPPQQGQQLLACTGAGQSGALLVLRQSIAPELITEVPLAGVWGLWAVRFRPEGLPWEPDFAWHSFLLLSVGRGTKVLQTGEELSELQASQVDFALQKPTLLAANLLSWARTVQVCPDKVLLLAGSSKQAETSVQELLAVDESATGIQGDKAALAAGNAAGVRILAAAAADPYVLLHLSNGSATLLRGSLESGRLEPVAAARPALQEVPASDPSAHITSCTLYEDCSGWLARTSGVSATVFCVTCNASSLLQIFALPNMELVFDHSPVTEGAGCLSGEPEPVAEAAPADIDPEFFSSRPVAVEIRMDSFSNSAEVMPDADVASEPAAEQGMPCERPVLTVLLSDGGMLAYQAFAAPVGLRFARLQLNWVGHADGRGAQGLSSRLTRFDGLGEGKQVYSGLFIAGVRPLWLVASRGTLVPHPMQCSGPVAAMTPFNNVNCPQGFITAGAMGGAGALHIGTLPAGVRLDTRWPMQRVGLRATPHALAFLPAYDVYALLVTRQAAYQKRLPEEEGGDTQATYAYAAAEAAAAEAGKEDLGQLRLVRPGTWTAALRWDLMPAETPLCVRQLSLLNSASGQLDTLLAVGTSQSFGEDYPCTGRLLFFRVAKGDADPATQLEPWTADLAYIREFQGPVTALAVVEGSLVIAWGARLECQRWNGQRLETTAFHEAPVLVTSLCTIKRFLVAGDAHKGIAFLQLAPDSRAFNSLAKDFDNCDVLAVEFLINGPKLFVLAGDAAANLRLFTYQPDHPQSWAGRRMLPVGVLHGGHDISCILPAKLAPQGVKTPPRGALIVCLDGSMASLAPLWLEGMAPPLRAMQRLLELKAPAPAGLNSRTFRERFKKTPKAMGGGEHWGKQPVLRTVVDGDLLWRYQFLPHAQQTALAYSIGVDKDQLLALLDSLAVATAIL